MSLDLKMSVLDYAAKIGEKRNRKKKKLYSEEATPSTIRAEIVGVIGEIIFGYSANELFDSRNYIKGDDGFDFHANTKRIQVKSTEVEKLKYLATGENTDFDKIDIFVLVAVDFISRTGYVVGWISRQDFMNKKKLEKTFWGGSQWQVSLDDLQDWPSKEED